MITVVVSLTNAMIVQGQDVSAFIDNNVFYSTLIVTHHAEQK